MLIVLSPAKTLDYESEIATELHSQPKYLEEARSLVEILKDYEPHQISELMGISGKLGVLNAERYQSWQTPFNSDNARQAMLAFKGDVYTGLDAASMTEKQLKFADKTIRHLSGLYGLLKPLDLMQPYRLEMGTKLENPKGKDLYAFWGEKLTEDLNKEIAQNGDVLVNLASTEYFKSIKAKQVKGRIVTPVFKDLKNGNYKIVSFFAKKARGLMARYIVDNEITDVEEIKGFDREGYIFNPALSKDDEWVFTRDKPA